jgi:hypothetical protein
VNCQGGPPLSPSRRHYCFGHHNGQSQTKLSLSDAREKLALRLGLLSDPGFPICRNNSTRTTRRQGNVARCSNYSMRMYRCVVGSCQREDTWAMMAKRKVLCRRHHTASGSVSRGRQRLPQPAAGQDTKLHLQGCLGIAHACTGKLYCNTTQLSPLPYLGLELNSSPEIITNNNIAGCRP